MKIDPATGKEIREEGDPPAGTSEPKKEEPKKEEPKKEEIPAAAAAKGDLSAKILEEIDGVKERLSRIDGGPQPKRRIKVGPDYGPVIGLFQGDDE